MEFLKITKSDFEKLDSPVLFEDEATDRAFGIVSIGTSSYKFGWQSTEIKPNVSLLNDVLLSIGIDQVFIIFDYKKEKVILKLFLNYFFYDVKKTDDHLYVITELEVIKIKFDISCPVIIETYALPDYFESVDLEDNRVIKCSGGQIIDI